MKDEEVNLALPPIEMVYFRYGSSNSSWTEVYLVRFYQGTWQMKKLFVIGKMRVIDEGLSPDRRFYFMSAVNNGTFLGDIDKQKFIRLDNRELDACFSPNSRYLLGSYHFGGGLVLFDLHRGTKRSLVKQRSPTTLTYQLWFGWYPDSRSIWYAVPSPYVNPKYKEPFFRIDLTSGQRHRLSQREEQRILSNWDFLDPRCLCLPRRLRYEYRYAYSSDRKVRVKVGPYVYEDKQGRLSFGQLVKRLSVILEWRDGRSKVLLKASEHDWWLDPQDVTLDGRWVLLLGNRASDSSKWDVIAIDTASNRRWVPFSPHTVPVPEGENSSWGILNLWFGKL